MPITIYDWISRPQEVFTINAAAGIVVLMVVCVGGAGSIAGPFAAAMGVGILDVAGKYWLPQAGSFPVYIALIAVLLWKPNGLAGRRGVA